MNVLLDTHVWLWSLLEPERLPPRVATVLADVGTRKWLSPLSVWESMLLIERKRLTVDAEPHAWVRQALIEAPVEEAPLSTEVVIASRALATAHRDPVDRFLAATAQVFDLTLVTADRALHALPDVRVMKVSATRRRGAPPRRL